MRVVLVRHAQTDRNRDGRVQGLSDPPLTELGREQAQRLADHLRSYSAQAIYSSPLQRAVETARPIAASLNLSLQIEPSLIELDAGELDGLSGQEMRERYPEFMRAWSDGTGQTLPLPGGESLSDVQQRAWRFIESLSHREELEAAVCVSHHFVLLTAIAAAIHLPLGNLARIRQGLASYSVLDFRNGRVQVQKLSESCHLVVS